jgi:fimbrial chaperone protein
MNKNALLGIAFSIAVGLAGFFPKTVSAQGVYRLLPMSATFSPTGSGTTKSFEVNNSGDVPVAIEVYMTGREIGLEGEESNPDAGDDFVVYPPQMIVPPGQTQLVRVTWLGDPDPDKELAYRIVADQVPIDFVEAQQGQNVPAEPGQANVSIRVFFRYSGTVYITPNGVRPEVVLTDVTQRKGKDGKDELILDFENIGTAHKNLTGLEVNLTSEQGKTVTLTKDNLQGVIGENILAGNKRRFVLPWPKELPVGPVTATFTTN